MKTTEETQADLDACESAWRKFHEDRRVALEAYIEERTRKHVKSGGNDSPSYRMYAAIDGMRDIPGHSDRDVWRAAWEECAANAMIEKLKRQLTLALKEVARLTEKV